MDQEESPAAQVGLAFTRALAAGKYQAAHRMLVSSLRDELRPSDLKTHYEGMTSYWTAPVDEIKLGSVFYENIEGTGRKENEAAWADVAIYAHPPDDGVEHEAILVRVVRESGQNLIGQVVWGRP
jgi:hypothetical protein